MNEIKNKIKIIIKPKNILIIFKNGGSNIQL